MRKTKFDDGGPAAPPPGGHQGRTPDSRIRSAPSTPRIDNSPYLWRKHGW